LQGKERLHTFGKCRNHKNKIDKLTQEQRRKNMRAIKRKGSKIEKLLTKELWSNG
jgi:hypothetical protein